MVDGFVPPITSKRPRNTKGLLLTAESLAPPVLENEDGDDYNLDAYVTQATPEPGAPRTLDPIGTSSSYEGTGMSLKVPQPTKVSRKKPANLGIKPTRPAPDAPIKNDGSLNPSESFMSTASGHSTSSRAEMERELASMEISASSRSSTKSKRNTTAGDEKSTTASGLKKGTRKKSEKADGPGFPELRDDDLKVIGELGAGNGGTVNKVLHSKTGMYMAKKLVLIDAKPAVRKQILRELQIMHHCSSSWIVSFYGAFLCDVHVGLCMEYMDRGSLDGIYKKHGAIPIDIVGKVAEAVLEGLTYLYDEHRIIHRDIKPSNILVNSTGEIKICDFGVSGELINSIANTFVGTSTYMSVSGVLSRVGKQRVDIFLRQPERIQGGNYSVKSDVWSLGISLIELALGRFPFSDDPIDSDDDSDLEEMRRTITGQPNGQGQMFERKREKKEKEKKQKQPVGVSVGGGGMNMSILDLLQHIVNEPAPKLTPLGKYPKEADGFVDDCLKKEPKDRASPKQLLQYDWIRHSKVTKQDLQTWAEGAA